MRIFILVLALVAALIPAPANAGEAGTYIVVVRQSTQDLAATAHKLAGQHDGDVRSVYDRVLRGFSVNLTAGDAARLARHPDVTQLVPDQVIRLAGVQPSPPSWGLDRIDQRYLPLDNSYTFPDAAVPANVIVIDSGIRISHADFGGRAQHLFDFVDNDQVADDCHGHGTAVAGVIGGATHGVAKEARLLSVRVADCNGNALISDVLEALHLVPGRPDLQPAVVNLSLDLTSCAPEPSCAPLHEAIQNVIGSGYPVVVAAGNGNQNACDMPAASFVPAITVGATQQSDARRPDSNFGPCLDLYAPGDAVTLGHTTDTATTTAFAGTSIAAAHVSGVVAMLMSNGVPKTPEELAFELNSGTTTRVVGGLVGTDSPNKLVSTSSAPLQGDRWAYVWAHSPSATAYTPSTHYQGNSTGALNTITRQGPGQYTVRFTSVGTSSLEGGAGGVVHVTPYGSGFNNCKIFSWFTVNGHIDASVRCFSTASVLADTSFTASFTSSLNNPRDFGFVWAHNASATTTYTPSLSRQFNSMGRTNTVTRLGPGRYSIRMPGLGVAGSGGTVLVTAFSGHTETCFFTEWLSNGTDLDIRVLCRNLSDAEVDAMFTVTFARRTATLGALNAPGGFVLSDKPLFTHTPPMPVQHNSAGGVNTVLRTGKGLYTVVIPGLGAANGHVQVTSKSVPGNTPGRCRIAKWSPVGVDLHVELACFGLGAAPWDSEFTLSYVR